MDIELFDYDLPEELIAQSPSKVRDQCRLMLVDREHQTYKDAVFADIYDYLHAGDVLVRNDTKVLPSRLIGTKEESQGKVELLLLKELGGDEWECLVGHAKSVRVGSVLVFGDGRLKAVCTGVYDEGIRHVRFLYQGIFLEILESLGEMPLPPYIKKQCESNDEYQTVYAKHPGSAAAPTAGFHFTEELLDRLVQKGIEIVDLTLDIGLGTFRPVKVKDTKDHHMHSEMIHLRKEAAGALNKAKAEGRRIVAVGTTCVRTLEAVFSKYGTFVPVDEATNIFISPGYEYKAVDALITNFHLPKSTLIMLVSAFMGRKFTLECYEHAVSERYRFFSFGDAMFIYGNFDYSKAKIDG